MPTIASHLDRAFRAAISAAFGFDADPIIANAQNEKFGDYQSNAAMGLAKQLAERTGNKSNPRQVAEQIKARLDLGDMAAEVSIAGPGFINVRLSPDWLARRLEAVSGDPRLGVEKTPVPQTVVVDYSGPNIAKQMHVGHIRSTIIGDAVARTLAFRGDDVIRQNHLGDWGTQFGKVVLAMWYEAAFTRSGNRGWLRPLSDKLRAELALGTAAADKGAVRELAEFHQRFIDEDPDGTRYFLPFLREDALDLDELERVYVLVSALTDSAAAQNVVINHPQHGPRKLADLPRLTTTFIQNPDLPDNEQEKLAWEKARAITLKACGEVYRSLGVQLADPTVQEQPLERGESFYNPFLPDVVRELKRKGIAVESEGATVVPVPGFEAPLIIEKGSGGYLYGTTDLAAIRFRTGKLKAKRIVYFVDARQGQHFVQVFWTAKKAGWADGVELEHAAFGTMLGPDGKPFKTRSGDVVKLKDLIEEAEQLAAAVVTEKNPELPQAQRQRIGHAVGIGAVKYADFSKDRASDYMFSWEKMMAMEGNTAPYLQYAYARVRSIFRKAAERGITMNAATPLRLESPFELALAKHVLRLSDTLDVVARELKPHHLCTYLYELSTKFSGFFENCPVLQSDEPMRSSRLRLVELTAKTLALGLDLLGIEHPDQM
jgi:arginyl-tRNA synthetase